MKKVTLLALSAAALSTSMAFADTYYEEESFMESQPESGLQLGAYLGNRNFDIGYAGKVNEGAGDVSSSYNLDGSVNTLGGVLKYDAEIASFEFSIETGISDSFDSIKKKNCLTGCDGAAKSPSVDYLRSSAAFSTDVSHWLPEMNHEIRFGAEVINTSFDVGAHAAKNLDSYKAEAKILEMGPFAQITYMTDPKVSWKLKSGLYYTDGNIKGSGSYDAGVIVVNESNNYDFTGVVMKLNGEVTYAINDRLVAYAGVSWSDKIVDMDDSLSHNVSLVNNASAKADSSEYGEFGVETGVKLKF